MGNRTRQVMLSVSAVLAAAGLLSNTAFFSSFFGGPVRPPSGRALWPGTTMLAPNAPACAIWSPIFLGVFVLAGWAWTGRVVERPRVAEVIVPASLATALTGAWLLLVRWGDAGMVMVWLAALVGVVVLALLTVIILRLSRTPPTDAAETVLLDVTFGLAFGWTAIVVLANLAAAGYASGVRPRPAAAEVIAAAVLVAVGMLGVLFARKLGGRVSIAIAMAWGLVWIAAGRLTVAQSSVLSAAAALGSAILVLGAALTARMRAGWAPRPVSGE